MLQMISSTDYCGLLKNNVKLFHQSASIAYLLQHIHARVVSAETTWPAGVTMSLARSRGGSVIIQFYVGALSKGIYICYL